jgi:maleate isomerase
MQLGDHDKRAGDDQDPNHGAGRLSGGAGRVDGRGWPRGVERPEGRTDRGGAGIVARGLDGGGCGCFLGAVARTADGIERSTMTRPVRLGMLTPSSNTVLEPVTAAMLGGLPEVSAHFSRFPVTEISLSEASRRQFDLAPILEAARLLADAKVDVIAWNGTSAAWLGFDTDERLCAAITEATGTPATTSMLALNEALGRYRVRRFALATPYLDAVQERILENYRSLGLVCVAERHLGDPGNFSFAEVSEQAIAAMVREVAAAEPEAIAIVCTNLRAAPLVEALERDLARPVLDTVAVAVWKSLSLAGIDPARVRGWGRLFEELRR